MYNYYGYTTTANNVAPSVLGAGLIIVIIIAVIICLAMAAFYLVALAKLFKKAGRPAWAAIVPYYNIYVLLDIIGYKWYYIFIYIIPIIPFVGKILSIIPALFGITMSIKLAKAFGKDTAYGIGIAFLSIVFVPMLAFSKEVKYVGQTVNGDIDFNDLF